MKLREFVGTKDEYPNETAIVLTTNDYNNINVWQEAENSSFKKIGAFNASEIDNAMHGEKKISRFLENKFDLKNIYSLNDFHSIYEISTTENIDSTNDIQKIANNTSYMNIGDFAMVKSTFGIDLVIKTDNCSVKEQPTTVEECLKDYKKEDTSLVLS